MVGLFRFHAGDEKGTHLREIIQKIETSLVVLICVGDYTTPFQCFFTLSPIIMVQWKITLNERIFNIGGTYHFPLNHDYGRKGTVGSFDILRGSIVSTVVRCSESF